MRGTVTTLSTLTVAAARTPGDIVGVGELTSPTWMRVMVR